MFNALPILCMSDRAINLRQTERALWRGKEQGKWKRKLTIKNGKRNQQQKKVSDIGRLEVELILSTGHYFAKTICPKSV